MAEEEKELLTCDEIFCHFLGHVAKQVNHVYYKTVLRFILLYRDCLNEIGWQKRREHFIKCGIPLSEDETYWQIRTKELESGALSGPPRNRGPFSSSMKK